MTRLSAYKGRYLSVSRAGRHVRVPNVCENAYTEAGLAVVSKQALLWS